MAKLAPQKTIWVLTLKFRGRDWRHPVVALKTLAATEGYVDRHKKQLMAEGFALKNPEWTEIPLVEGTE